MDPVSDKPPSLSDTDALRISIDEYRFQVRLNADRINYWYTINIAMFIAAGALTSLQDQVWVPALVFGATSVTSVLCALAVHTQHQYYRAARNRAMDAAKTAGVPGLLKTTPGMREETATRFRVVVIVELIFILLAVAATAAAIGVLNHDPQLTP